MIFIEKEFAFFDELELFNQFVYQIHLVEGMKKQPKPRNEFYQIWMPFYMESQLKKLTEKGTNTRKRKRKVRYNGGGGDAHNFLLSNCRIVQRVFETFRNSCENSAKFDPNNACSNEIARHCVKMAPSFHHPFPVDSDSGCPMEIVSLVDECLPSVLASSSSAAADDGAFLCSNRRSCPLSVGQWVFPQNCSFLLGDVALIRHFLSLSYGNFDLIVADPPWRNRTVKRQRTYQMFKSDKFSPDNPLDCLGRLPIPQLLADDGLFCIWLSNSQTTHKLAQKLLEKWKLRRVAHWHWLKICKTGEPVCAFRPEHKVPFETVLIACKDGADGKWKDFPDDFCIISVPNANPSRKPPISLLLQQLGFICPVRNGLELYARYLLPKFTSVGFEATKFQHQYYFHFE